MSLAVHAISCQPLAFMSNQPHTAFATPHDEQASFEPSTSCSNSITHSDSGSLPQQDGFILHRVTKLDTLAGLAIKYNVNVSDIKRANGILSDNGMFAREHVKIPTGQLPIGEDAHVLFARLLSGYGRDASLNAKERRAPGTVSITQLPGSPNASRSSAIGSEAVDDDPGTPYSRRSDKSQSEPGDVELMERTLTDTAGYGYGSDKVRRRGRAESNLSSSSGPGPGSQLATAAEAAVGWLSNAAVQAAQAAQSALPPATGLHNGCLPPSNGRRSASQSAFSDQAAGSSGNSTWQQFSQAVVQGSTSLVKKIQKAASQPALLEQPGGFGDVADALLTRNSTARMNSLTSSSNAVGSSIDLLAWGTGPSAQPPRKDTKGD